MRLLAGLLTTLLLAGPALAQEAPIQNTIRSQIEAFEADDFARAFTFASPSIHALFGTSENFGKMVREGYPMVWHPSEVEMQDLRFIGGAFWQRVRVTDGKGQSYLMDYQMVEGPDGWLINAVQMQVAPDVGA
jgi:hypothetical protein